MKKLSVKNLPNLAKKIDWLDLLKTLILGILAGISISIGCIANLSSGNKIVGALFFVVGLFLVLTFNFNLFTGKVCYATSNKLSYSLKLPIIWIGNLLGAWLTAGLVSLTRLQSLQEACETLAQTKLADSLVSLFVLGIFCNILIYVAVHGFKNFENTASKVLALFFGVSVFVLAGFEHCVADMFYFAFAGHFEPAVLARLLIITLGNIVGGLFLPLAIKLVNVLEKNAK